MEWQVQKNRKLLSIIARSSKLHSSHIYNWFLSMERNIFEERFFHTASVKKKIVWKASRMHPYSALNTISVSLIQQVHSSVRRAPVLNMVKTLESRIDRRQHRMRWSEGHRKEASPPHTHTNETGKLWRKKTRQQADKCR